jgi:hypothetical protein
MSKNGEPTWKIEYKGKIFITSDSKKVVLTAYVASLSKKKKDCSGYRGDERSHI